MGAWISDGGRRDISDADDSASAGVREPRSRRSRRGTSPTSRPTSAGARSRELGLPGFRAKQLSQHYFARLATTRRR